MDGSEYHDATGLLRCPHCGFLGDNDDFDVIGADDGNLFCPSCGDEVTPEEFVRSEKPASGELF